MKREKTILVVDDEPDIVELVRYNLEKEGFEVLAADHGEKALSLMNRERVDLLILDLMLPGMQGLDVCRRIKENPAHAGLPVIMLTAKSDELDRVLGLEMGADDYVVKPFGPRELVARVKAVLRRAAAGFESKADAVISVGDISIDTGTYTVLKGGNIVDFSATEFRLLLYLARNRGRVFSRDQLLDAVWKDEAFVEPRTVDVHIRRLRSRIEEDPSRPEYIKTKRGIGYFMDTRK